MADRLAEPGALRRYHEATKHSPTSVARSGHRLDWSIKPLPFKVYRDLEPIPVPEDLGRLCRLSNGVLRSRRSVGGEPYGFRAAPCTGALYHVELYLATAERDDLPAGLYHYGAHDHALRRVRSSDVRGALARAARSVDQLTTAPLVAILTSTFWRNAWKYQARAYRHTFWDSGAVLANLLALTAADGTPVSVVMGFADGPVNALLGTDAAREAAVALVAIGAGATASDDPPEEALDQVRLATLPLSAREVRYAEIEEAHHASALALDQMEDWRGRAGAVVHSVPPRTFEGPADETIERRRSTRRFTGSAIGRGALDALIAAAVAPIPGDAFVPPPVEPFLIVNAVEGLDPGTYRSDLTPIRLGDLRDLAGGLALWQELGGEAAVNVYWLSDVEATLGRLGERGYRVAQIAGGIAGARVELAATSLGLGATGLTFFDDEVTATFEPAADGRQVMYLAAVGRRAGG